MKEKMMTGTPTTKFDRFLRTVIKLGLGGVGFSILAFLSHWLLRSWADVLMHGLALYAVAFIALVAAWPAAFFFSKLYDLVIPRIARWQKHRVRLSAMQNRAQFTQFQRLEPTTGGLLGGIMDTGGRVVLLDTTRQRDLVAARGVSHPNVVVPEVPQLAPLYLPESISIQEALGPREPSLQRLIVGVQAKENGGWEPVARSLHDLMHFLAIGVTGTGKSTWLLSFLYQVALAPEEIGVMLVDVHGSAFNVCREWDKLLYPVARSQEQAIILMEEFYQEAERRKSLYEAVPMADSLETYNANRPEGMESLVPWLMVIDEGTLMLSDHKMLGHLGDAVQGTRQYGGYVFLTGQSGNARVLETQVRSNFVTRFCLPTEKPSMRAVLGDLPEEDLGEVFGRGWFIPRGHVHPIMVQAPFVKRKDFYEALTLGGPQNGAWPSTPGTRGVRSFDARVQEAYDSGSHSMTSLLDTLGMHTQGGSYYKDKRQVQGALDRLGLDLG